MSIIGNIYKFDLGKEEYKALMQTVGRIPVIVDLNDRVWGVGFSKETAIANRSR